MHLDPCIHYEGFYAGFLPPYKSSIRGKCGSMILYLKQSREFLAAFVSFRDITILVFVRCLLGASLCVGKDPQLCATYLRHICTRNMYQTGLCIDPTVCYTYISTTLGTASTVLQRYNCVLHIYHTGYCIDWFTKRAGKQAAHNIVSPYMLALKQINFGILLRIQWNIILLRIRIRINYLYSAKTSIIQCS